jgi:hypothetical protein
MIDYTVGDYVMPISLQEWKDLCHKVEDRIFTDAEEDNYYYDEYPQHPVKVLRLTPPRPDIVPEDPWREYWEVHIQMTKEDVHQEDVYDDGTYGWDLFIADAFRKATEEELRLYRILFQ